MRFKIWGRLAAIIMCGWSISAQASVADFAPFFDITLEEDNLPSMKELEANLVQYDEYRRKYGSFYDLLGDFDQEFLITIAAYGSQEKRLKGESEDAYIEFFKMMPKKYYQYLGPVLFEVPNMSEKVLNLPGIKETKNKFPTRIAEQVKDIEDLEFLSPAFYPMLMPEAWPGFKEEIERPQMTPYYPKVKYDEQFYASLKKLVKPEKFMPGYQQKAGKTKSDLRTIYPSKDSLLTSADIKSFISTIDAVDAWTKKAENEFMLSRVGILLTLYDREDALGKYVPGGLIELAHPCARLVQKTRIWGKERELAMLIAGEGFTLNEWAYTCDKTIKAYRVANVHRSMVFALREYQRGIYDDEINGMSLFTRNARFATMQAIIQAHKAPLSDVVEFRKNREAFQEKLEKHGYSFFGYPINSYK